MKPMITLYWDRFRNESVHAVGIAWTWDTFQGQREVQLMFSFGFGTLRIFTLWP